MKRLFVFLGLALISMSATIVLGDVPAEVNAQDYGFNATNATAALQAAINTGAKKVIVPNMGTNWIIGQTINLVSNQELYFEPGVVLLAKRGAFTSASESLVKAENKTNIILRGYGATLRMWKTDYQNPPYSSGEWRHTLSLRSCANVQVLGLTLADSGGDGIYLGVTGTPTYNQNIVIRDVTCDNHHRQGISVISARNLLIENSVLKNTSGTAPMAGIDFEPNAANEFLEDIVVRNCSFENNQNDGIIAYIGNLRTSSADIGIKIENCQISNSEVGIEVFRWYNDGPAGTIEVTGCSIKQTSGAGILFRAKHSGLEKKVIFRDCVLEDTGLATQAPLFFSIESTDRANPQGGAEFIDCVVNQQLQKPFFAVSEVGTSTGIHDISGNILVHSPFPVQVALGATDPAEFKLIYTTDPVSGPVYVLPEGCDKLTFFVNFEIGLVASVGAADLVGTHVGDGMLRYGPGIRGQALAVGGATSGAARDGAPQAQWRMAYRDAERYNIETPLTLSFWFKNEVEHPVGDRYLLSSSSQSGHQFASFSAGRYSYQIADFAGGGTNVLDYAPANDLPVLNDWNHFVLTWDYENAEATTTVLKVYRDGALVSSGLYDRRISQEDLIQDYWTVGYDNATTTVARISYDEINFWRGTATAAGVAALYQENYPFPNPPVDVAASLQANRHVALSWKVPGASPKGKFAKCYHIYRGSTPDFPKDTAHRIHTWALDNSENAPLPGATLTWTDESAASEQQPLFYAISALIAPDGNDTCSISEEVMPPVTDAHPGVAATGGDYTYDKMVKGLRYRFHVFTTTGASTLNVTQGGEVEYLVVGGGGGGGGYGSYCGGGGGGAVRSNVGGEKYLVLAQTYTVQVGTGGLALANQGGMGLNSSFAAIIATGGGGGGSIKGATVVKGLDGSSGGGGAGYSLPPNYYGIKGLSKNGMGHDGGNGNWTTATYSGGGGGGAGSAGLDGTPNTGGNGGQGVSNLITGDVVWYGGGGGGSCYGTGKTAGSGGSGGGAPGRTAAGVGAPGAPNTGGGGGGAVGNADYFYGGSGGSGIVIVRYVVPNAQKTEAYGGDNVYDRTIDDIRYRIHVYTNAGTAAAFTVTRQGAVEYLVVGGGGAAGGGNGGGGGAGGLLTNVGGEPFLVVPGTYPVKVGGGGAGVYNDQGNLGTNSSFAVLVALGGGGGGGAQNATRHAGTAGGSGGGGVGYYYSATWYGMSGAGTYGQGYAGGYGNWTNDIKSGGGGGGAGAVGAVGTAGRGGKGGDGTLSSITGKATWYAGGGGGGVADAVAYGGAGGLGGGAPGRSSVEGNLNGRDGLPNTGGGGGAAYSNVTLGGTGGSGIVVIRYVITRPRTLLMLR